MTDPNKPANQQVHRSVASSNWTRTEQFKRLKLFYTLESACEVVPFVLLESNAAEQQEQKKADYSESKPERVNNLSTGLCYLSGFLDSGHTRTSSRAVSKGGCASSFTSVKLLTGAETAATLRNNGVFLTLRSTKKVSVSNLLKTFLNMTTKCLPRPSLLQEA